MLWLLQALTIDFVARRLGSLCSSEVNFTLEPEPLFDSSFSLPCPFMPYNLLKFPHSRISHDHHMYTMCSSPM
jgi:hypothetical protein